MIDKMYLLEIYDKDHLFQFHHTVDPELEDVALVIQSYEEAGMIVVEFLNGECYCGGTVQLLFDTNECFNCGRLYNSVGQQLRPPEEWEEDEG